MTDEELKAIEARAAIARDVAMDDVPKLVSEVRRLRALVEEGETNGARGARACPWCQAYLDMVRKAKVGEVR